MGRDKQFLPLNGHPLIAFTIARFQQCNAVNEIVLVTQPDRRAEFKELVERYAFSKASRFADGGAERQDSVWNGIQAAAEGTEVVLIHDGARPCITPEAIEKTASTARKFGAAVVATKVTDTIKEAREDKTVIRTVDRSRLWAVQTPQAFRIAWIKEGYAEVRRQGKIVTDDTAAVELIGKPVHLVENTIPNLKLTTPADVALVEWLLRDCELKTSDRVPQRPSA
jgi:2-C-methyl-D-erythritol 4-phosphate cytidylyltransferase